MIQKLNFCNKIKWGVLFAFVFLSAPVMAIVPFVDNGTLLRPGRNNISVHTQIISREEDLDFNGFLQLDEGFLRRRDFNVRYFIGFGESGFLTGYFFKWIPFPDYKHQPAIGASTGISYNWVNVDTHYVSLHLRPLISKEFPTVIGTFISYLAFPASIRINNFSKVEFPLRISIGIRGELFFIHFHKFDCNIEISADLTGATADYLSFGIITSFM